jgi:hypothetical protein
MKKKNQRSCLVAIVFLLLFTAGLFSAEIESPPAAAIPECAYMSVGSGYGLNYGGIGFGVEFNPRLPKKFGTGFYRYASLNLGFGYMPGGGIAYSFALQAYPLGRERFVQPRLGAGYGVVAIADEYYSGDETRAEGAIFGVGVVIRWSGAFSLDADAQLIVPVDYRMDELKGGRFRFSAGLRYRLP